MTILRQNYTANTFVSKTIFYLSHEINFVDRTIFLLFLSDVSRVFFVCSNWFFSKLENEPEPLPDVRGTGGRDVGQRFAEQARDILQL